MIKNSDLLFSLSGGAGNRVPAASLGGARSSLTIQSDTMENLFPNVTAAQISAGYTDYLCVYLWNDNVLDTMFSVTVFLVQPSSPSTTISIGADPAGPGGTATTIANITTAPAGVSFSSGPINLGNLTPQQTAALWIRRVVTAGASVLQIDNFEISVTAQET